MNAPPIVLPRLLLFVGARRSLPGELAALGISRPWILTDRGIVAAGVAGMIVDALGPLPHVLDDAVAENPTIAGVDAASARFVISGCDGIVALGGGSVLDTAKGVAIVASLGKGMTDHIGKHAAITGPLVPLVAIPTTAGSGSDASPATGIHPHDRARAIGTRSPYLVPRTTIADAELTAALPAHLTAATGLDALSHCIEAFLTTTNAPLLDGLALLGIGRVSRFLESAVADGSVLKAREQLLCASFEGGAAITKGLGPAHALANALGDRGLHHGALVAAALPLVLTRAQVLQPERTAAIAEAAGVEPQGLVDWLGGLMDRTGVTRHVPAALFADASLDEIAQDCSRSPFNLALAEPPGVEQYREWLEGMLI